MAAIPMGAERTDGALVTAHGGCISVARRFVPQPCAVALDADVAEALARLLPLLGCGEEAAIAGFDRLAAADGIATASRGALRAIARDERRHDALLRSLQAALPSPAPDLASRRAARRFHFGLSAGGAALQLARIAGIDAAVCTIISRVLRPGAPLAKDPGVAAVLNQIRRDEARHVAISRYIVLASIGGECARNAAAQARRGLADLLSPGAAAFERLGTDPARLDKDIRALPHGLFPR